MPDNVLEHVRRLYPEPWVIGWNRYADLVQVEVTRRRGYARHERRSWTAPSWTEMVGMVTA